VKTVGESKSRRQQKMIELVNTYEIETQEELADYLRKAGFHVTQATISRDIRELKLSKVNGHAGRQKYVAVREIGNVMSDKLGRVLAEGYLESAHVSKMIAVRTMPGMAMAVAAALDAMPIKGFIGCVAGDDTVFCALSSESDEHAIIAQIEEAAGKR
jgi:transcriptional regulator of arginine metabolism